MRVMFVTTTMTYANKGKSILKNAGIRAEIKKVQGGTASGCLYGIVTSDDAVGRAGALLEKGNIRIISVKEVK